MEKYFKGLKEEKEIKSRYKELAKQYHPDLGGDLEVMKAINDQYRTVLEGSYQEAGKSITEIDELLKNDLMAMEALNLVVGLPGVEVELCGIWIWVTGNTQTVKQQLKDSGFRWARKKLAWYWRAAGGHRRYGGKYSLEDIRGKYGSSSLNKSRTALV